MQLHFPRVNPNNAAKKKGQKELAPLRLPWVACTQSGRNAGIHVSRFTESFDKIELSKFT